MKKYAVVDLMGGFGNQIFQYSFGKELSNKGFKVSFDSSNYETRKLENNIIPLDRELVFTPSFFNFSEVDKNLKKIILFLKKTKLSNTFFSPLRLFNDKNYGDLNPKIFNKYSGYWQKINVIEKNKNFLIKELSKNKILKEGFSRKPEQGSCMLHVRRGDYLAMDEALSLDFYQQAINKLSKNIKNFNYTIFTDDYEWAKKQNTFNDAKRIQKSSSTIDETLKDFAEMVSFENYIVGNSTFPLIAALLGSTDESRVIIADPWFRNSFKNLGFNNNWIKIENSL